MKSFFAVSIAALLFMTCSHEVYGQDGPKLALLNDTIHYGTVMDGEKVIANFRVKNVGQSPLTISKIIPGCACIATKAMEMDSPLLPGEETSIHTTFDTHGFSGTEDRTIQLLTDDPNYQVARLRLTGIVTPRVRVEPRSLAIEHVIGTKEGSLSELSISVTEDLAQFKIRVRSASPYLKVTEPQTKIGKISKFLVSLQKVPAIGEYRERIGVTVGEKDGSVTVPVFLRILHPFEVRPGALSFGAVGEQTTHVRPTTRFIDVITRGDRSLEIAGLRVEDDAIQAKIETLIRGKRYRISCSISPEKLNGNLRSSIIIIPEDPDIEPYRIKVHAVQPLKLAKHS